MSTSNFSAILGVMCTHVCPVGLLSMAQITPSHSGAHGVTHAPQECRVAPREGARARSHRPPKDRAGKPEPAVPGLAPVRGRGRIRGGRTEGPREDVVLQGLALASASKSGSTIPGNGWTAPHRMLAVQCIACWTSKRATPFSCAACSEVEAANRRTVSPVEQVGLPIRAT